VGEVFSSPKKGGSAYGKEVCCTTALLCLLYREGTGKKIFGPPKKDTEQGGKRCSDGAGKRWPLELTMWED